MTQQILYLVAGVIMVSCNEPRDRRTTESGPITIETINQLKADALKVYKLSSGRGNDAAARDSTVIWLKQQSIVRDAGISQDGETIFVLLNNGVELDIGPDRKQ
jgi:hypothetical protein